MLQVPLQPPPAVAETSTAAASNLALEIKCSKPPLSFSLDCSTTSTIAVLKQQLRKEQSTAPLADDQRWLLKGKVMADTKLLRDYDVTGPINLMLKPGATYPPKEEASNAPPMLRLNTSDIPPPETIGHIHDPISTTEFQAKVQQVQFWQKTLEHLRISFDGDEHAAVQVWEQWFGSSKHWLTPNLIAKIREDCNVLGTFPCEAYANCY